MTLAARLLLVAGCGLVGLVVGVIIVFISSPREQFWQAFWPLLLAGIAIASAAIRSGFAHTCTYVGRQGVARFACKGGREKVTCEVFRFRDATELRTAQTLRYVNGVYQNTTYSFDWSDVGGRTRYTISGSHRSQSGNPPSTDAYHFARAAEFAWTYYLLENEYRQIELAGSVAFNLKGGRWLRLLPKGIYFSLGGETVEWDAGDIAAAQIEKGVVRIKRNDAREGWFSSTGVMKFPFSDVANAQLFFHLLEKLVGVRVV